MNEQVAGRRGSARDRLLDLAEAAVLQKGFGATSIEELIAAAGISKSGFFYHFRDKNDLARALIVRYLENDQAILDELFGNADALNEDPLHGFLVALKMFADMMANLPDAHPGCLAASYCYQEQLFSADVRALATRGTLAWRARFRERFESIAKRYPPCVEVDLDALAYAASVIIDGGITLSKQLKDPVLLPKQVMLFRAFIKAVFEPRSGAGA
jgi:TetR/AcrR family transcriptional repressor of nem operon